MDKSDMNKNTNASSEEQVKLQKIKIVAQDILDEVVRVCEENSIRYFLAYGTLLGAVRHKGFIPWDDDIDIWMLREDYEKFAQIAPKALGDRYVYQNRKSVKKYPYSCAKVRMKGTLSYDPSFSHLNMEQGIFIDIFPLDKCSDSEEKAKKLWKKCCFLNMLIVITSLNTKTKKRPFIKNLKIKLAKFFIPRKLIEYILDRQISKYNKSDVHNLAVLCEYPFFYISSEEFCNTTKLPFENKFYDAPKNYDRILKKRYGNYMELPPPEQQKWHFTDVDFGDYSFEQ